MTGAPLAQLAKAEAKIAKRQWQLQKNLYVAAWNYGGGTWTQHASGCSCPSCGTTAVTPTAWGTAATGTKLYVTTNAAATSVTYSIADLESLLVSIDDGKLKLPKDRDIDVLLEDGSILRVSKTGSFQLLDKDAKVTYKATRVREFNPFVNASDLLAEFIKYLGTLNIKRGEVQSLPLGLFVNWLVIRAAEVDEDPIPADIVPVPKHRLLTQRIRPRCLYCQRFIKRVLFTNGFTFCNPAHASQHFLKLAAG